MNIQVAIHGDKPTFARIIVADSWQRNFSTAQTILSQVCEKWPTGNKTHFLLTSSGFIDFDWIEPENKIQDNWYPSPEYIEKLQEAAEKKCRLLIHDKLRERLNKCADYLSIGIDAEKFNKIAHPYCWPAYPHIEFVAIIDLKTNHYYWTGKSYPEGEQARGLLRNSNIANHFIHLPLGKILVLACHDLVMEFPRGISATKIGGARDKIRKEFESILQREKPTIAIHHAHTSNDPGIWRKSFNHLQTVAPSIEAFISTGVFSQIIGNTPEEMSKNVLKLKNVLKKTTNRDRIDFTLTPDSIHLDLEEFDAFTPVKQTSPKKSSHRPIDSITYFDIAQKYLPIDAVALLHNIYNWAEKSGLLLYWSPAGSFSPMYNDGKSDRNNLISVKLNGVVQIQFKYIFSKPPFNVPGKRLEFIHRMNAISGVTIKENTTGGFYSIPLSLLAAPDSMRVFLESLDWFLSEIPQNQR